MPQGKFKLKKPMVEKKLKPVKNIEKKPKPKPESLIVKEKIMDRVTKQINRKNEGSLASKVISSGNKLSYVKPIAPIVKKEKQKKGPKKANAKVRLNAKR